jgi:hypothetical protein
VFKDTPAHDWASHPADAFMTVGVSWRAAREQREEDGASLTVQGRLLRGSVSAQSFGALKKRHLQKARQKRESSTY